MGVGDVLKPIGVFLAVILVIVAGTALVGALTGSAPGPPTDGKDVDGQSPKQFQPDSVVETTDPEDGELTLDGDAESKHILIDTKHSNQYSTSDLEPLVEVLVRNGHTVDLEPSSGEEGGGGFGQSGYSNATLQNYDAFLTIGPTGAYSERELNALEAFADAGGRIVLLGESTQFDTGSSFQPGPGGGFSQQVSSQRPSGDDLAAVFGLRIGSDRLYNLADDKNDNNYESIYAKSASGGALTDGVDRVQFDSPSYVVRTGDSDAQILVRALEGTKTLNRGQADRYPVAAQNENFVLVADTSFVDQSELYDVDNEQFVGNLLAFLVSGDKDEGVPSTPTPSTPGAP